MGHLYFCFKFKIVIRMVFQVHCRDWSDDSVMRGLYYSCRELGFSFQYPLGSSQLPITLVPVNLAPLSGLCAYEHNQSTTTPDTQIHIIKIKIKSLFLKGSR